MNADPVAKLRVTLLFDGLDEVAIDQGDRVWVAEMLMELESRYPQLAIHATCRVKSYGAANRPWRIYTKEGSGSGEDEMDEARWPVVEIESFDSRETKQFIAGWFAELHRSNWFDRAKADELADTFSKALAKREELQDLARSPLMLTLMCIIHGTKRRMPSGRGGLYDRLVRLLLGEWEKERLEAARGGDDRFDELCRRKV